MSTHPYRIWIYGCFGGPGHCLRGARDVVPRSMERWCDVPPAEPYTRREEPEGERTSAVVPAGWSYVSWWDRRGDSRMASHTGILAQGVWTPQQLAEAARKLAPWAIRVPLGTWADPEGE